MEILARTFTERGYHLVVLLGRGMIGSAVSNGLQRLGFQSLENIRLDWPTIAATKHVDATQIQRQLRACDDPARLSVAWCAGQSNFFSTMETLEEENAAFDAVRDLSDQLRDLQGGLEFDFHFLSSAGGLFESQRVVTAESVVAPKREYGHMKWAQEQQIRSWPGVDSVIYRPSSVYGPTRKLKRHGLINHLIANASSRRGTVLDGNVMALRDYVYTGDIGAHIARQIYEHRLAGAGAAVHFLVSGRCASIFEVVARIERVMKQKIRYRFDPAFGNSANITFSSQILPQHWCPSSLEVGISQFLLNDQPQTAGMNL